MGRWRMWFIPAGAIVALALSQADAAGTMKLGVAGPLTGDQGAFGHEIKNGVLIAVDEWNAKGGVLGRRIEIVWGDDQHDPKQAVAVANKFINEGDTPCTLLAVGTALPHDVSEYPDSNKVYPYAAKRIFRKNESVGYWEGEV